MRKLILVLLLATSAFGADYYISPTGNNTTGDGTSGNPWQTFAKGYGAMSACDTLILKAGTYTESTTGLPNKDVDPAVSANSGAPPNGTAGTPCWTITKCETAWSASTLNTCILDGTGSTSTSVIWMGNKTTARNYVKFQDLFTMAGQNVIGNGTHDWFLRIAAQCDFGSQGSCLGSGAQNDYSDTVNYALYEDIAVWGHNTRANILHYRCSHCIFRRVVIRQNGCFIPGNGSGQCGDTGGVVGQTTYASTYSETQNVISLDKQNGSGAGSQGCDFCTAWQPPNITAGPNSFGGNAWRGTISLNSDSNSYSPDTRMNLVNGSNGDGNVNPMWTYENIVGITAASITPSKVFGVSGSGASGCQYVNVTNATAVADAVTLTMSSTFTTGQHAIVRLTTNTSANSDNVVVTTSGTTATYTLAGAGTFSSADTGFISTCPDMRISVTNASFYKQGGANANFVFGIGNEMRSGAPNDVFNNISTVGNAQYQASFTINSQAAYKYPFQYANLKAITGGTYNSGSGQCVTACGTSTNPLSSSPVAWKYTTRIESTSFLHNAGVGGTTDIGANVVKQYGCDGCFWGDTGYATLSSTDLWPYPYEAGIKTLMCADDVDANGAAGTRGFCSTSQTITSYVWGYLGNTPNPSCTTTAPTNGQILTGAAVSVTGTATASIGTVSTQFLANGANLGTAQTGTTPGVTWNTTSGYPDGTYTFGGQATDGSGNTVGCTNNYVNVVVRNNPDTTVKITGGKGAGIIK